MHFQRTKLRFSTEKMKIERKDAKPSGFPNNFAQHFINDLECMSARLASLFTSTQLERTASVSVHPFHGACVFCFARHRNGALPG